MAKNGLVHQIIADYKTMPYEWGYTFGTLASDGGLYYAPPKCGMIELGVTDKEFADLFSSHINSITSLNSIPKLDTKRPNVWRVRVNHIMLVRQLLELCNWGTYQWEVPVIIAGNFNMTKGFLNAYLDGDGNVSKNHSSPMLRWVSVNWSGLNDIQLLLHYFGIKSCLRPEIQYGLGNNTRWVLGIYTKNDIYRYYDMFGITMSRKRELFLAIREGL